ncbi:MAG: hypothetical protein E7281_04380 [Lachnospiraceae bacterium]|nr:hypothetical protein [Lachnospiraceae bacterium]
MNTQDKKNLWFYPLGTVGRDMIYVLFTNFILLYVMYTRELTNAQLAAITGIIVAARIFDALNDPIMGNIIERTRTKYGKFKPWLVAGIISTCFVVYFAFNSKLEGWNFIIFFGVIYFLYSITYTMNDISYWGMVPALSSDGNARDTFTARATLFAGIGSVTASILIPLFTTGEHALGGSARTGYGLVALAICILAPAFSLFTIFGVRENRDDMAKPAPPLSFKKICDTIFKNDQLMLVAVVFLLQEVGNCIVTAGPGSNYIYFEFGYEGGLYSTFTTIGMLATAFLMVFYPAISKKFHRKPLVKMMAVISTVGYLVMLIAGLAMESSMMKFWIITIGFMLANFGQYGLYLILMISIINTVEYNEYTRGNRDEAIITSMRPFLTKLSSSLVIVIATISYMLFNVTDYTNQISSLENAAQQGKIDAATRSSEIANVIAQVGHSQTNGLLITITVIPLIFFLICCFLYLKFYKLDEEYYDEICQKLQEKKNQ